MRQFEVRTRTDVPNEFVHIDGFFDGVFELVSEDIVKAILAVRKINDIAYIHLHVKVFSSSVLKAMVACWPAIVSFCKSIECNTLVASYETEDTTAAEMWKRFINRFGFNGTKVIYISTQEV